MAKLVDAHDSGSCGEILGGSTPPIDSFYGMPNKFTRDVTQYILCYIIGSFIRQTTNLSFGEKEFLNERAYF